MTRNEISEKTAAQRRTALLALAAGSDEAAGECLTPAAMTACLDNSCSPAEKALALRHISLCRRCYGEWLALAELRLERGRRHGKKTARSFLLRPFNLAAIGSAMAAMVCVGLFFNIVPISYRPGKEPAPPAATSQKDSIMAPVDREKSADKGTPPAPARRLELPAPLPKTPSTDNRAMQPEVLSKDSTEQLPAKSKNAAQAPTAPTAPQPAASPPRPVAAEQKSESAQPEEVQEQTGLQRQAALLPSLQHWQQEWLSVCREEDPKKLDQIRIRQLFQAGKMALPVWRQEFPDTSADHSLQSLILALLDQAQTEEQLLEHCRQILATRDGKFK